MFLKNVRELTVPSKPAESPNQSPLWGWFGGRICPGPALSMLQLADFAAFPRVPQQFPCFQWWIIDQVLSILTPIASVSSSNCACSEPELILPSPFPFFECQNSKFSLGKIQWFLGKASPNFEKKALRCF